MIGYALLCSLVSPLGRAQKTSEGEVPLYFGRDVFSIPHLPSYKDNGNRDHPTRIETYTDFYHPQDSYILSVRSNAPD